MNNHNLITRDVFHKIHKKQISSKIGFKKVSSVLNHKNLKLNKNYFKDYFQNGVLNYREQELNKVIRLFKPYQNKIKVATSAIRMYGCGMDPTDSTDKYIYCADWAYSWIAKICTGRVLDSDCSKAGRVKIKKYVSCN